MLTDFFSSFAKALGRSVFLTLLLVGVLAGCHGLQQEQPPAAGAAITYRLERPGKVSVNIYDATGQVACELLHIAPRTAGAHTELWDGCDTDGKPLPAGHYTWKLVAVPGFTAEYLLSLGANYPYGPYPVGAPGSHGGPTAAVMNSNAVYVAASATENIELYLAAVSPDGAHRLWGALHRRAWEGGWALGLDGDELYVLSTLGHIYKYNATTGADLGAFDVPYAGLAEPKGYNRAARDKFIADRRAAADMDAGGGQFVVAYPTHNLLRLYRGKDGQKLTEWTVPKPVSVAITPDGQTIFAVSSNTVVRVSTNAPVPTVVVTGLGRPEHVAYDPHDKTLLVYDGATSQLKRFSLTGQLLATYARAGGRQDGLYQPQRDDFRGVTDVSADGMGGFIVAEANAAPRRVAHFDHDGHVIREWYGGQKWAPYIMVDPDDPSIVYMNSQWGTLMRLLVDYQHGTWAVHSTYTLDGLGDGIVGNDIQGDQWRLVKHDGQTFFFKQRNGARPLALRLDETNWQVRACTVYFTGPIWSGSDHPAPLKAALKVAVAKNPQQYMRNDALWIDANGDGLMQPGEVQFNAGSPSGGAATEYIDRQGGILLAEQTKTGYQLVRRPVQRWTEFAPVYQMGAAGEQVLGPVPARFKNGQAWSAFPCYDPATSNAWCAFNSASEGWGGSADSFLVHWRNGREVWEVGHTQGNAKMYGAAANDVFAPGTVGAFRVAAGSIQNCVTFSDYSGGAGGGTSASLYTWDENGLYVGGLLDNPDTHDGKIPLWLYGLGGETISVDVLTDPRTKDVLVFGNWENDQRVYRVRGWSGWEHAAGELELKTVATGLRADYFADVALTQPLLTRLETEPGQHWPRGAKSARWFGKFRATTAGDYTFAAAPGLPVELMVNLQGAITTDTPVPHPIALKAGQRVLFQMECRAPPERAGLGVTYAINQQPPQPVAATDWSPLNPFTTAPFGTGTGLDTGRGRLLDRETGWHRFNTQGSVNWVELWVDGKLILKVGKGVFQSRVWLEAGRFYDIRLTGPVDSLDWATPKGTWGGAMHRIPMCQLYSPTAQHTGNRWVVPASPADVEAGPNDKGVWELLTDNYQPELSAGRIWSTVTGIIPFRLPRLAPGEEVTNATFRVCYLSGKTTVALHAVDRVADQSQPEVADAQVGQLLQAQFVAAGTATNQTLKFSAPILTDWVRHQYAAGAAGRYVFLTLVPGASPGPFTAAKFDSGNSANPPVLELETSRQP